MYDEAKKIALSAKFPEDIIAEIDKEHGDKKYQQKAFAESIKYYIETIGHVNPSYVI